MILQVDLRRANNCEIMLTKVKMPFSDMMVSYYFVVITIFKEEYKETSWKAG